MTIFDHYLFKASSIPLCVLKEAVKEANDVNYVSKLRGLKKCPYCKYEFPEPSDNRIDHCKCT